MSATDMLRDQASPATLSQGAKVPPSSSSRPHADANCHTAREIVEAFSRGDASSILDKCSSNMDWTSWSMSNAAAGSSSGMAHFSADLSACLELNKFAQGRMGAMMAGGNRVVVEWMTDAGSSCADMLLMLTFDDNGKLIGFQHFRDISKRNAMNAV